MITLRGSLAVSRTVVQYYIAHMAEHMLVWHEKNMSGLESWKVGLALSQLLTLCYVLKKAT